MAEQRSKAASTPVRATEGRVRGPEFVRWFGPLLQALRDLGDSARPKEASERIATNLAIDDKKLNETLKSGASRFLNQVYWARFYLDKSGFIHSTTRGIWTLTEKGRSARLSDADALAVFASVQAGLEHDGEPATVSDAERPAEAEAGANLPSSENSDFKADLARTLRRLSANGFERLCQLILRSAGFDNVEVTGRSGDGGIDGIGTLRINPLLTGRVVFQCKRYTSTVGPAAIRELRGAMDEGVDHGIFLATTTFSAEAKREAASSGKRRIQLVDIDDLLVLLEQYEIGIRKRVVTEVDKGFFAEYGFDTSDHILEMSGKRAAP